MIIREIFIIFYGIVIILAIKQKQFVNCHKNLYIYYDSDLFLESENI